MITLIVIIIEISRHPLIRPLLFPKISSSKIYNCRKILGKTDFTDSIDSIDLVRCTDWALAIKVI